MCVRVSVCVCVCVSVFAFSSDHYLLFLYLLCILNPLQIKLLISKLLYKLVIHLVQKISSFSTDILIVIFIFVAISY